MASWSPQEGEGGSLKTSVAKVLWATPSGLESRRGQVTPLSLRDCWLERSPSAS